MFNTQLQQTLAMHVQNILDDNLGLGNAHDADQIEAASNELMDMLEDEFGIQIRSDADFELIYNEFNGIISDNLEDWADDYLADENKQEITELLVDSISALI